MSSFITTIIGIVALLTSLFCAFGFGIDVEKSKGKPIEERDVWPLFLCLIFAVVAILLLLVRS